MEYVLIQALGKDAESGRKDINGESNGGYKLLGTLIAEMSEQMRELQMDMENIQKKGNYTMHPRYESGDILSRREQDAQDCLPRDCPHRQRSWRKGNHPDSRSSDQTTQAPRCQKKPLISPLSALFAVVA